MKKHYLSLLMTAVFTLSGILSAWAETQSPYTEEFEDLTTSPSKDFTIPKWGRIVDYLVYSGWGGDDTYVEYTYTSSGGQNRGYLKAGTQNLSNDNWDEKTAYDLLITPALTGDASVYLKKSFSYLDGSVQIYYCTKNEDGSFTKGDLYREITNDELASDTEWAQFSFPALPAGTYLGFRLHFACMDSFTAASAEIELKRSLEINSVNCTDERKRPVNADGKLTINVEVKVTNTGDIALQPGEDSYSISIVERDNQENVFLTQNINVALEPKASTTVTVSGEITPLTGENSYYAKENIGGTTKFGMWIEAVPYVPELVLTLSDYNSELEDAIAFGLVKDAPVSKQLCVSNNGGAPLVITAVEVPEGYTHDLALPLTIPALDKQLFNLTLGTESAGNKSGNITFTADGIDPKSYAVSGLVLSADNYYENFETGIAPGNLIFNGDWEMSKQGNSDNRYWAAHDMQGESNYSKLITPLLTVQKGESLTFFAASIGSETAQSQLNVYYSADRQTWTLATAITKNGSDPDLSFSNNTESGINYWTRNEFKMFSTDAIPTGDWYIGFEAGYACVDNIFGYRLATVEHDLYITASKLPATGTVNYDYTATLTASNLNNLPEADGAYTATLYFDDEAVATAETSDWAATESKEFTFTFTPHAAGTYQARIELAAGEYKTSTPAAEVTINPEQNTRTHAVGTANAVSEYVPFRMYNENSDSEVIYTKDVLGLETGAEITSITYTGYCENDKDYENDITVWLENTADGVFGEAPYTARDVAEMTQVYNGQVKVAQIGSSDLYEVLMTLTFDVPFTYTGGNLRVSTMARSENWKKVYFSSDNTISNTAIYAGKDDPYERTAASWGMEETGMPVILLGLKQAPTTLSGKVADESGAPLAGAEVSLTSGNVLYSGVTDENGAYSLDVFQADKTYALTAVKEGYNLFSEEGISFAEGSIADKDITLVKTPTTGLDGTADNSLVILSGEGSLRVITSASGEAVVYNLTGMLVARQPLTVGSNDIALEAGSYIVRMGSEARKAVVK